MTMDHAAAHEGLADLALEPRRLWRIEDDTSADAVALRAHLALCGDCRAELDAWRRVHAGLDVATADAATPLRSIEPSEPPGPSRALRERTLAAVRAAEERVPAGSPVPGAAGGRDVPAAVAGRRSERTGAVRRPTEAPLRLGRLGRLGWLAAAAALMVAVGFGALLVQRTGEADQARLEAGDLAAAAVTLDRILAEPTHWVVTLRTADGAAGGTLAWSPSEVVVLTSALAPAGPGTTYQCWVERNGTRTPIGKMSFSGGVGYWAGSAAPWGALQTGSRFGVSEIAGSDAEGPAILVADL